MRNKVLRAIFPDRATAVLGSQVRLNAGAFKPDPASEAVLQNAGSSDLITQVFSQLTNNTAGAISPGNGTGGTTSPFTPSLGSAANASGANDQTSELFSEVSKNLDKLRSVTETQVTELGANTSALSTNTAAKSTSQTLSTLGNTASSFLGGLTALPLISGIFKLFDGSSTPPPPPIQKYSPPATRVFDEDVSSGSNGTDTQSAEYDRFGNPRTDLAGSAGVPNYASLIALTQTSFAYPQSQGPSLPSASSDPSSGQRIVSSGTNATQVTVNIHAMDSRSFLDRSQDIAQAVREAMLNMHSINDVVNDL